jgi:glycosyltransferase involved in cell wall biosynthesis
MSTSPPAGATSHDDVWLVIPLYNEAAVIGEVVAGSRRLFTNVVCIDDGSTDGSAEAAAAAGAHVVRHPVNLGQGAALQTGFEYALSVPSMQWVVTFDADGQHQIEDAAEMVAKARTEGLDVVFGSRFLDDRTQAGAVRRLVLRAAVGYTNLTTGTRLTDAHNGLRVLSRDVVGRLDITQNRMAHASELVAQIGDLGVRYGESPVHILYTEYSKAKGQSLWNSVNILVELILR